MLDYKSSQKDYGNKKGNIKQGDRMFILTDKDNRVHSDWMGKPVVFATEAEAEAEVNAICGRVGYNLAGWYVKAL